MSLTALLPTVPEIRYLLARLLLRPPIRARFIMGSVRARASRYNLCSRTGGNVPSCGFHDGQHGHAAAEELESAAIGGKMLGGGGAVAEEGVQIILFAAETARR